LSSSFAESAGELLLSKVQQKTGEKELKGLKSNYIEIKGKNFVGRLFKVSNVVILRLKCPQ